MRKTQRLNVVLLAVIPLLLAIVLLPAFIDGCRRAGRDPDAPLIQLYRPAERMRAARTVEALDTSPAEAPALWIWLSPLDEYAVVPVGETEWRQVVGREASAFIRAEQVETHLLPSRLVHPDEPMR